MAEPQSVYDLVVVGGGINGAGIAADAAGRGLSVLLCEQDDLGSATSSNSSKLIHGGLRYLEHYEFKLVRKALAEREVLLANAPHIMWPLRFRLPHRPHLRPGWMIRFGLFLYDNLAKRVTLPSSKGLRVGDDSPLKPDITKCYEYSDAWVDDARLVVLNAIQAKKKGATVLTQTRCESVRREGKYWQVGLRERESEDQFTITARGVVNAAGPWVSRFFDHAFEQQHSKTIRLVKGSHIVVPRMYDGDEAYILQNADDRIVFVIPYEDDFSLVGTTDVDFEGDPKQACISNEEIDYLLDVINDHFRQPVYPEDIVHTYSGVRPLIEEQPGSAQTASRDYRFDVSGDAQSPILLSVYGGKITTYRRLAENGVDRLAEFFPSMGKQWTRSEPLPGGDFTNPTVLMAQLQLSAPGVPEALLKRWVRLYGSLTYDLLGEATEVSGLGHHFGADLYQQEVDYLIANEWATCIEDIIWRRTKLGLRLNQDEQTALSEYITQARHGAK